MKWTCALGIGFLCTGTSQGGTGDNCTDPIVVMLPADLPFADLAQTTCGRGNDYADPNTCLGVYNGGEDIIYQLQVTVTVDIEIVMDPNDQIGTAIALDDTCPPAGPACLASCVSYTGAPCTTGCLRLTPGTYTLAVDCSNAVSACIPAFNLTINPCQYIVGACCVGSTCIGTMSGPQCATQAGTWFDGFDCASPMCLTSVSPLPDACASAYEIGDSAFLAQFYTSGTADGPPGSCNVAAATVLQNDVWFTYTAASDGSLTVEVAYYSYYDGLTVVYTGTTCGALTELYCLNSGGAAAPDRDSATFDATAGTKYWVQIGKRGRNPGGGLTQLALHCATAGLRGDLNCDGSVSFKDINPFVLVLSNASAWQGAFPGCPLLNGDINGDGTVSFRDINPFVMLLSGG